MSKFESIFSSNSEIDPNLKNLFDKKIARPVESEGINESQTESKLPAKKFKKLDPETEKRTIFIGNLHRETKKEDLIKLFKNYGKIESVRFRNIVPEDITKSKKYAFITKQTHPNKQTITGFVRFKDEDSAKTAANETNGLEYKSLHIRVDIATKSKVHDNKRSVFLGGLPFDCSDEEIYSHFSTCGPIEFVRLIRDNKTGIGKGFGYVQFKTADTVSLAVRLNGSTINGRKIRVERCVKKQKENKIDKNSKISKKGKEERDIKPRERPDRKEIKKQNFKKKWNGADKPNLTKEERSKSFKLNKIKRRKLLKKRHVSTNKKDKIKFKI